MALPTIVFIPGAWHSPEYYEKVVSILQAKGFPVETVSLPSVGGTSSMYDDAIAIQAVTAKLADEGKHIILVMHSYGGIPGTESAKGLSYKGRTEEGKTGGIVALVYLSSHIFKEGMSIDGISGGGEWPSFLTKKDGRIYYETQAAIANLYNDLPPEDARQWVAKLQPQSVQTFFDQLTYAAHRDIPATYLLCENDQSIPLTIQQLFVSFAEGEIKTRTCAAGHSPMITMPHEVVDTIVMAAENAAEL